MRISTSPTSPKKLSRHSGEARLAADLLKSHFFEPDFYTSYQDTNYWVRFEYPYWWNNLVSALDIMAKVGFSTSDAQIEKAIDWLIEHQQPDGLWKLNNFSDKAEKSSPEILDRKLWVSLAVCMILKDLQD